MRPSLWLASASVSVLLSGCANLNSIYREFNIGSGDQPTKSITMDVKQRTVLSSVIRSKVKDGEYVEKTVICAEPSPDALSVYAAGLSGSVFSGDKKAAELALSSSETGSFIGNRTVTIQLLRDNLYRACEGYMGGALTEKQYYALIRRYQVMTMGLLAIEHLTETVKPPNVTITAGAASASQGGGADAINKATDAKATASASQINAKERRDQLKTALTAAEESLKAAPSDAALKKKFDDAKAAHEAAQTQFLIADDKLKSAVEQYQETKGGTGLLTKVSGGSLLSAPAAASQASAAANVATVAKEIVELTVSKAFELDDCLSGEDGCFSDSQKEVAVLAAQSACADKESDTILYLQCVSPIAALVKLDFLGIKRFIQDQGENKVDLPASPASPMLPQLAKEGAFSSIARTLTPKDQPSKAYRLDVFYTDPSNKTLLSLRDSSLKGMFSAVKPRPISKSECVDKFRVPANALLTIRYDGTEEEKKVERVLFSELKKYVEESKIVSQAVVTPTPLYISVFLCGS
jgi:hypothetical protein